MQRGLLDNVMEENAYVEAQVAYSKVYQQAVHSAGPKKAPTIAAYLAIAAACYEIARTNQKLLDRMDDVFSQNRAE